jgi:hypothetical protein
MRDGKAEVGQRCNVAERVSELFLQAKLVKAASSAFGCGEAKSVGIRHGLEMGGLVDAHTN